MTAAPQPAPDPDRTGSPPDPPEPARPPGWFKRLHPAARAAVALVAPIATIVTTLLATGIITPAGANEALAKGVAGSVRAGTSKLVLRVNSQEHGEVTRFSASGAFDYQSGRGHLLYDIAETADVERAVGLEARFVGGVPFIRVPAEISVAADVRWIEVDPAAEEILREAAAARLTSVETPEFALLRQVDLGDPSAIFGQLKRAGDVKEVGERVIFGTPTHGYRGTIPASPGEPRVRATAWIANDDLIRRLQLSGGSDGDRFTATIDFSDYGAPVDVELPDTDEVIKASTVVAQLLTG